MFILNFQFLSMFSPYFGRIFDNFVKLGDEDVWELELEPYDPVLFHVKKCSNFELTIFLGLLADHFVARQGSSPAKS